MGPRPVGAGPWARARVLARARAWALSPNSKIRNPKIDFRLRTNPQTFRHARVFPSRQGVMKQASFIHGEINFRPKKEEKGKTVLKLSLQPSAYFSFKGSNGSPSLVSSYHFKGGCMYTGKYNTVPDAA